jgi:surface polysaccharide O-acyltransferase-like enzyme
VAAREKVSDRRGACFLIGTGFIIFIIGVHSSKSGHFEGWLYEYLSPNVILTSSAAFLLIKNFLGTTPSGSQGRQALKMLGSLSLGIYLIHPLILFYLRNGAFGRSISSDISPAILSIPVTVGAAYGISIVLVFVLRKIPLLRAIVP